MNQILYDNIIPKISNNIEFSNRDNEYIVTLKDTNFHLKISSSLFHLLEFVDNNRNIPQIVTEFNTKFKHRLNNQSAYELLYNKLGHYNIIENNDHNFIPNSSPSYLKLNLIIINAKNAKFLSKPFLCLFSNNILWFLIPTCFCILSMIVFVNYDEIFKNLKNSSIENIFLYVGIMIISSLFHELGHTTATYKFGGHHSGIGIGFYLFTPVLYADVSSAWKFDANKRIVVNLAGIYFELLLSTLLILVSLIISFKPLLTISMMILIKTLYNFNPFFRTDGYWVLSDAIRIPNLRTTSNELLKKAIKKLNFNLTKKQSFLVIYALISNSFILFFLFYLFIINPSSLLTFPVDTYLYIIGVINNKIVFSLVNVAPLLTPLVFYILVIRLGLDYIKKWKNEKKY